MLAHWLAPLVAAIDQSIATSVHDVPSQRDPTLVRECMPVLKALTFYFGVEIRGWERLPPAGPYLVVGNHSGGMGTADAAFFMTRWLEEKGPEPPLYGLAYDLLFAIPGVGRLLPKLGMIPASPDNARKALALGAVVVDFPGGDHEVFRPWSKRNRIDFGGHQGFIKVAIAARVPVVPMTIYGAHQSTLVLTRGEGIARRLGFTRLNVKVYPLIWNIPFGPTPAWVPSLQLPSKVTVDIGTPLDWTRYGPEQAGDPQVLDACYREITDVMQGAMDTMAREHPYPILARLNELHPLNVLRRLMRTR
jgi:1-acyl-sn-glycerol-3-phosphate acyltransferase